MRRNVTRTGPLALASLLALALLAPPSARADDPSAPPGGTPDSADAGKPAETSPQPRADAPPPSSPDAPPAPAPGEKERQDNWVDVGHSFIERGLFAPILRLDRFFSDEREIETEREQSFLRWRNEVRFAQDASRPAFTTSVNATLRLPALGERLRRLRVVIAGQSRDAVDALFPKEPGTVAPTDTAIDEDTIGRGDAGLRFFLWDTLPSHADLGGGILLELPPGVYGRIRFRFAFPVGPLFLTRTALIGFWRSDVKFGTTATLELDRPVKRWFLLRWTGSGTRSERSNGVEWASEVAALGPLSQRSAAQLGVAWTGATAATTVAPDPTTGIARTWKVPTLGRTRAYVRLRSDVYRRWLFVEIEPELAWPWSPERGRYRAWGLMLRVEVQFHGKEAPPPAPAPPPPEPKDPSEEPSSG